MSDDRPTYFDQILRGTLIATCLITSWSLGVILDKLDTIIALLEALSP